MVYWPSFMRELMSTEQAWNAAQVKYPREDAVPWLPYPMSQFVTLLTEAMMVAVPAPGQSVIMEAPNAIRFLDVGCGPGTKIRMAEALYGVKGYGIDIVPRFVHEAQAHGVKAMLKDAYDLPPRGTVNTMQPFGYGDFQIVYVNRPSANQDELESLIMDSMAADTVLIAVNWRNDPAKSGWFMHYQEYGDPVCGVFVKP